MIAQNLIAEYMFDHFERVLSLNLLSHGNIYRTTITKPYSVIATIALYRFGR